MESSGSKISNEQVEEIFQFSILVVMTLFTAYVLAAIASSSLVLIMVNVEKEKKSRFQTAETTNRPTPKLVFPRPPNYRNVRMAVLDRNLFNSEGELPDETALNSDKEDEVVPQEFNLEAPCSKSQLPLELHGTIYSTPAGSSIAMVKEKDFTEVDVYRVGDVVIGHDAVTVVEILPRQIVFNNDGRKECLTVKNNDDVIERNKDLKQKEKDKRQNFADTLEAESGGTITLQSSWVEEQLGDGFGKIIQSARLVPSNSDNRVQGFKIYSIKSGTLFSKIGLKNGDLITKVNSTVLSEESGFALFQAFVDERDITIHALRGEQALTINIQIK